GELDLPLPGLGTPARTPHPDRQGGGVVGRPVAQRSFPAWVGAYDPRAWTGPVGTPAFRHIGGPVLPLRPPPLPLEGRPGIVDVFRHGAGGDVEEGGDLDLGPVLYQVEVRYDPLSVRHLPDGVDRLSGILAGLLVGYDAQRR